MDMDTIYEIISRAVDDSYDQGYDKGYADAKALHEKEYEKGFYRLGHEDGYKSGLDDAWECARKVCDVFSSDRLLEIFGTEKRLFEYSASEAMAKIKEYEDRFIDKKDDLKGEEKLTVGDEVIIPNITYEGKAVVTKIDENYHCVFVMFDDGEVNTFSLYDYEIRKTGKHHFSITAMLDSLKEVEDEEG